MRSWISYFKKGFSRERDKDFIAGKKPLTKLTNLLPFFTRHWRRAVYGTILVFVSSIATYVMPLTQRFLIDKVILSKQINLLLWVVLFYVILYAFSKLGNMLQQFYFTHFGQSVMLDIQDDLLKRVFHFPKAFFDDKETGYLISRINNDIRELQWFFSGTIVFIVSNLFSFIVGLSFLFYLKWYLALGVIVVLPCLVFCVYYFSVKIRNLSHNSMEQQAVVMKRMNEALSSIPLLKAFVSEKKEADKITKEIKSSYNISLEQTAVQSFAQLVINTMSDVGGFITLVAGVPLVIKGNMTAGSLFAFFAYLAYVYNPVKFFGNTNFQFQRALAALERVSAFYEILPEKHGHGVHVKHLSGAVEFRNVSFSYNGTDLILKSISFSLVPGEHVAITGSSGVGKTTLISLILHFYRPAEGEIYYDGRPGKDYAVDSLRRCIGYVSQNTRLLTGTIMDNLLYGNHEADERAVKEAARIAGIHDFIEGLPKKYNSLLGENGVNLSEGQRQRISIARALVKDPDILVLDEPSSSLDEDTEKSIFEILPEAVRNKTMIIVTHRQSTLKAVDRVINLNAI